MQDAEREAAIEEHLNKEAIPWISELETLEGCDHFSKRALKTIQMLRLIFPHFLSDFLGFPDVARRRGF
jgi:hypothetical protein